MIPRKEPSLNKIRIIARLILFAVIPYVALWYSVFRHEELFSSNSDFGNLLLFPLLILSLIGTGLMIWVVILAIVAIAEMKKRTVKELQNFALFLIGAILLGSLWIPFKTANDLLSINSRPPIVRVDNSLVVRAVDGDITYTFLRHASGKDTVGYSEADYQKISVSIDSTCWLETRVGKEIPRSCVK